MIYLLAIISILIGAAGQLMLKYAASDLRIGGGILQTMISLVNMKMILAILCFVSSMLLWIFVLRKMELSVAYPMVSLGYVFVMFFSACFLQEGLYLTKLLGTGMIVAGVIVLNLR
jgi:multidrug transporter EmrE-like cation transporter